MICNNENWKNLVVLCNIKRFRSYPVPSLQKQKIQKVGMFFYFFLPSFFSIHYSRILFRSTECEIYGFTMLSNQFHLVSPSFPLTHLRMALSSYCLCVWFLDWQFLRVFFLIIKKRRRNFCLFVCLFIIIIIVCLCLFDMLVIASEWYFWPLICQAIIMGPTR